MKIKFIYFFVILPMLNASCATTVFETINSHPSNAEIYWGKTASTLAKSNIKTPFKRSISEAKIEPWCFQIRKAGYHHSEVYCREKELSWFINVNLSPIKTTITSQPPGATIYWGAIEERIYKTAYHTPHIESFSELGANWEKWFFQVKKDGFSDSEIVKKLKEENDRHVHFVLKPLNRDLQENKPDHLITTKNQIKLSWDYAAPSEILGFEIERRRKSDEEFKKIATVGPFETSYTDSRLIRGETYYYRIRAYDAKFKSDYTKEIIVEILSAAKK